MSSRKHTITKSYNYTLILLCILLSAFCCCKIFLTRRHHRIKIHQQQGLPNSGGTTLNIARYRKTVTTVMCVEVTLVACYLPYSPVRALIFTHGSSPFLDVIWDTSVTLVYLNSSLNPIVYCWKTKEVRQEVKNAIRQFLCLSTSVQEIMGVALNEIWKTNALFPGV